MTTCQIRHDPGRLGHGRRINNAGVITGNYYDTVGGGIPRIPVANGTLSTTVNFPGRVDHENHTRQQSNQAVGWHSQGAKTLGFVLTGSSYRSVSYDDSDSTVAADINDLGAGHWQIHRARLPGGVRVPGDATRRSRPLAISTSP